MQTVEWPELRAMSPCLQLHVLGLDSGCPPVLHGLLLPHWHLCPFPVGGASPCSALSFGGLGSGSGGDGGDREWPGLCMSTGTSIHALPRRWERFPGAEPEPQSWRGQRGCESQGHTWGQESGLLRVAFLPRAVDPPRNLSTRWT